MRDGVELSADHYAPVGKALGTVLIRSPYCWERLNSTIYRSQFFRSHPSSESTFYSQTPHYLAKLRWTKA